jgi:PAS domain S-box-containing protein
MTPRSRLLSRFDSIKARLFLLLAIVLVPILLVQALIYQDRFETRRSNELRANMELARALGKNFERFVIDILHQELIIGEMMIDARTRMAVDIQDILRRSASENAPVLSFAWLDGRGRVVHSTLAGDIGVDLSGQTFFLELRAGAAMHISDLNRMRGTGIPYFAISRGFRDDAGELQGIVVAVVDPDLLSPVLAFDRPEQGALVLIDRNGRLAFRHPDHPLSWEERDLTRTYPASVEAIKGREVSGVEHQAVGGVARAYALSPIDSVGWVSGASRPWDEIVAVVVGQLIRQAGMFLITVVLSLVLASAVAKTISVPVRRLRERASRASEENGFTEDPQGPREIRELSATLGSMVRKLRQAGVEAEERAAELFSQRELLQRVLDVLPVGVFIADEKGGIARTNPAAEKIWCGARHLPQEMLREYKGWWRGTDKHIDAQEWAFARAFTRGEISLNEVIDIECFDGSRKTILNSAAPVRNERGEIISAVAVIMDITERIEAELGMRQAMEEAERLNRELEDRVRARTLELEHANRAKDEFLANMSHEIRTPMSGVFGMTDVLLQQDLPTQVRHDLEIVRDSSGTVLTLLNDLLDLSRIEQGKLELNIRPFSITEMLNSLVRPFEMQAAEKGIGFALSMDESVPETLACDPDRIGQVLKNLLSNAVKFTESGSIGLEVVLEKEREHLLRLRFSVSDTGIGIPEEKQDRLFQSFTQLDPSYAKRFAGTGLGLAISKRLVELMGGTIEVSSAPGKGSTFSFTLTFEQVEPSQDAELPSRPTLDDLPPLTILLAEDNLVNRMFLRQALSRAGHEIIEAEDGRQALEVLGRNHCDLVLMDIQMPEMDGMEAMLRIRSGEAGEENRSIPVIALTAYAMKGDRERFLAEGMDGYVSKPVDFGELALAMREVIGSVDKHQR